MTKTTKTNNEKINDEFKALDEIETLEEVQVKTLDENYTRPNAMYIPEKAKEKFRAEGYDLQWVRIQFGSGGDLDIKNIQLKEHEGYTFVKRADIPGITEGMSSYFQEHIVDHNGLYIVGDCALAKVPFAKLKAKRTMLDQKVTSRSRGIIEDLKSMNLGPNAAFNEGIKVERDSPRVSREVDFGD